MLAASGPASAQTVPAPQAQTTPTAPATTRAPAPVPDTPALDDLKADRGALVEAGTESLVGALLRMLLVLVLVVALAYVVLNWGLRKLMRLTPPQRTIVKLHERVALDAKKVVYLVEAGDEFLLLGAGEHEVTFLTRLDAERTRSALAKKAERPAPPGATGKPFWQRLLVKPPKPLGGSGGGPGQTS